MTTRIRPAVFLLGVSGLLTAPLSPAFAYDFWVKCAGRADYGVRYDLPSYFPWYSGAGPIYDFGNIHAIFSAGLPKGVDEAWLTGAVKDAGNEWEKYAAVSFGDTLGTVAGTKVRLDSGPTRDNAPAETSVSTIPGAVHLATITFNPNDYCGGNWTKESFTGVLKHELGHVLGLDDLYEKSAPYSEEFVDHLIPSGHSTPQYRPDFARQDNIMAGDVDWVNRGYHSGKLVIDNDEIAAVTWLWGGNQNQIVTGDLEGGWNGNDGRDTNPHHGDDPANKGLGWWDYRGTVVSPASGTNYAYVDLEFAGYETFVGNAYPPAIWEHQSLGDGIERFIIKRGGWSGNFVLKVKSSYSNECLIDAWVQGGRRDEFLLTPDTDGLTWDGNNQWAQVYGPVPEPGSWAMMAVTLLGVGVFVLHRRHRRQHE